MLDENNIFYLYQTGNFLPAETHCENSVRAANCAIATYWRCQQIKKLAADSTCTVGVFEKCGLTTNIAIFLLGFSPPKKHKRHAWIQRRLPHGKRSTKIILTRRNKSCEQIALANGAAIPQSHGHVVAWKQGCSHVTEKRVWTANQESLSQILSPTHTFFNFRQTTDSQSTILNYAGKLRLAGLC